MGNIYIYCAGGMGKEICEIVKSKSLLINEYNEIIFVDDVRKEKILNDVRIIKSDILLSTYSSDDLVLVANGEPVNRRKIYEKLIDNNIIVNSLVADSAEISPSAVVGEGTIISQKSIVSTDCHIGKMSYVNKGVIIGHDVRIGKFSVISPGVIIGGKTVIGDNCYIGSGAVLRDGIVINDNCIIGMGSNVIKNVECNLVMAGNPAKKLRENIKGFVF